MFGLHACRGPPYSNSNPCPSLLALTYLPGGREWAGEEFQATSAGTGQLISKKPAEGQEGLGKTLRLAFAFSFQRSEVSRCPALVAEHCSGLCFMGSRLQKTDSSEPGPGWSLEISDGSHTDQSEALGAGDDSDTIRFLICLPFTLSLPWIIQLIPSFIHAFVSPASLYPYTTVFPSSALYFPFLPVLLVFLLLFPYFSIFPLLPLLCSPSFLPL